MSVPKTFLLLSRLYHSLLLSEFFVAAFFFFFRRRLALPNPTIMDTKKLSFETCLWPSNFFSSYVMIFFFICLAVLYVIKHLSVVVYKKRAILNGFLILNTHWIGLMMDIWYIVKGVLNLIINLMINTKRRLIHFK